jgi:diadenosine tetraphosphate (Ap4A) HIT family hydrolase
MRDDNRKQIDMQAYVRSTRVEPCFICEIVAGNPKHPHHVVYEDDRAIAFLNRFPTLYGYTLVAPRKHLEQVTTDFTLEEYLALQMVVYNVAEALRKITATERMYILSLGSQQGNSHVHWHIAPLPPGVPHEEQQFEALSIDKGILELSPQEMATLAGQLRKQLGE